MGYSRTFAAFVLVLIGLEHAYGGPLTNASGSRGNGSVPTIIAAQGGDLPLATLNDTPVSIPLATDVYGLLTAATVSYDQWGTSKINSANVFSLTENSAAKTKAFQGLAENPVAAAAFAPFVDLGSAANGGGQETRVGAIPVQEDELDDWPDPIGLALVVVVCAGAAWFGWRRRDRIAPEPRLRRRRLDATAFLSPESAHKLAVNERPS
jgi:hypothetical protein